ncbi:hypothetical protein KJ567_06320 [Candidatus Bipolaricaulota bacterium]|nr:hypothetical protein [Candidatus Bipolaricaulota bacterium]
MAARKTQATIGEAEASDAPAVFENAVRTRRQCCALFLSAPAVEYYIASGATERYLRDNVADCHVFLREDGIVGMAICKGICSIS